MDFYICFEHKNRELNSACLLKAELERRGYKAHIVYLSAFNRIYGLLNMIKPTSIVIMPWMYNDENINTVLRTFGRKVSKIINLRCEQISSKKNLSGGYELPKEQTRNLYHVCWGNKTKLRLLDCGVDEDKLLLCGSINTDFNRSVFDSFFYSRDTISKCYNLDPKKKWILFISSFTFTSWSIIELNNFIKKYNRDLNELHSLSIESKAQIINWFKCILKDDPNLEFIYRPHPAELCDSILFSMRSQNSNFHIIEDLSVVQWLRVCDSMYTWLSTSIVDSFFLGKYCGILRPVYLNDDIDSEIMRGAEYIKTYEQFLQSHKSLSNKFPVKKETILDYYLYDEYCPSYKKLCDQIELIYNKKNNNYYIINQDYCDDSRTPRIFYLIIYYICHYIKLSKFTAYKKKAAVLLEKQVYRLNIEVKSICNKILKII